jgi:3-oxoacyl-[acyl-carrier-protein] synthase II/nodulation protein E
VAVAGGFEVLLKFSLYCARHYYGQALTEESPQFFGLRPGYLTPSEGACMMVLESAEHARARGARVYARIEGWRSGRFGQGDASRAIQESWGILLDSVGRKPEDLGLFCVSSGGSNRKHALAERDALSTFLREHPVHACISAPRSLVGEGESWASALQVALTAYQINEQRALPTWNVAADAPEEIAARSKGGVISGPGALICGSDPCGAYGSLYMSRF